jgi:hypothetical protein
MNVLGECVDERVNEYVNNLKRKWKKEWSFDEWKNGTNKLMIVWINGVYKRKNKWMN